MLQTDRLVIRPATAADAQNIYLLSSDPEVMKYTGDRAFANTLEAQRFIEDIMIPHFQRYRMSRFLVFLKDGTFIGWCGLKFFPESNEVDLGYRFLKSNWGKGHATEAATACLEYAFRELKIRKVVARVMPENVASIKVLQKLRMSFKGHYQDPHDPRPFILYVKEAP